MKSCNEIRTLMSAYLDGELTPGEEKDIERHAGECDECADMLEGLSDMILRLRMIPELKLPDNFHEEAMIKLRDRLNPVDFFTPSAKKEKGKKSMAILKPVKISWPRVSMAGGVLIASMFIISVLGSGISGDFTKNAIQNASGSLYADFSLDLTGSVAAESSIANYNNSDSAIYMPQENAANEKVFSASDINRTGEAFIKQYNIVINVEDFDTAIDIIDRLPGINAGMSVDYGSAQSANIKRNVPQEQYQQSKEVLRSLGIVQNENESEYRISGEVINLESQLLAKEEEINRLLAILEKSQSLNYMTAVERRISEASKECDNIKTQILRYNSQASSCVLNISVVYQKPIEAKPSVTYFQRLKDSFNKSAELCVRAFENIAVFMSMAILPAVAVFIALTLLIYIFKRRGGGNEK